MTKFPATRLFRRPADRQSPSRQLSRRDPQLRRAAGELRLHLLRRRSARDHGAVSQGRAEELASADPRGDRRLHRRRHRSGEAHHLQPEPGGGPRRARLGVQLRRAARLAEPHDAVQGEGRQGPRERLARPLRLSRADGRRHPRLSRRRTCRSARTRSSISSSPRDIAIKFNNDFGTIAGGLRRRLLPAAPSR